MQLLNVAIKIIIFVIQYLFIYVININSLYEKFFSVKMKNRNCSVLVINGQAPNIYADTMKLTESVINKTQTNKKIHFE